MKNNAITEEMITSTVVSVGKTFNAKVFVDLMSKFESRINIIKESAKVLKVKDPETEAKSAQIARDVKKLNKVIDSARMSAKRPYLDFCTELDGYVRPIQKLLTDIEKDEREKCTNYRRELLQKQREAEAAAKKAADKAAAKAKKEEESMKIGDLFVPSMNPTAKPMPMVTAAEGKVSLHTGGSASYGTKLIAELVDIKKVPERYLMVNWKAVNEDLKAGFTQIPGFVVKEDIKMNMRTV